MITLEYAERSVIFIISLEFNRRPIRNNLIFPIGLGFFVDPLII
jgi:hypothetical protein